MISPSDFLEKVEFRDAALLSFVTSAIIVPAYDAVKRDLGITRSEYLLLMALSHYPVLTAQDVSRLSGRPRNSISRAVHRMLAVGHLARDPDPTDARQARLEEGQRFGTLSCESDLDIQKQTLISVSIKL